MARATYILTQKDNWFFYSSRRRKGVWTILEQGLASADRAIKAEAESLVHLLGQKGRWEFRELLSPALPETEPLAPD
jgi:hypothetical protein